MPTHEFDVCAIGNALVDIIAEATDEFLTTHKIAKGGMTLVDAERASAIYDMIGPAVQVSGGSAGNTVAGIASLGGKPAYMGKVKADQLGAIFRHDMHAMGVHFATPPAPDRRHAIEPVEKDRRNGAPTGRCLILVTPDAQRSMNTYLGAAVEFGPDDVQLADVIRASQITYLEGYLFDPPEARQAFHDAAKIAHASGRKLALTLSDVFCVDRHRAEFLDLVKNEVDILFANQNGTDGSVSNRGLWKKRSQAAREHCAIAVTTRSEKGAIIAAGKDTHRSRGRTGRESRSTPRALAIYSPLDFCSAIRKNSRSKESARIGAICAAEVISHYGPRPQTSLKEFGGKKDRGLNLTLPANYRRTFAA